MFSAVCHAAAPASVRGLPGLARFLFPLLTAVGIVASTSITTAGPVQRHLEEVLPRGGQRGTTVEVTIRGVALEDVREAIFYRGGIEGIEFSAPKKISSRALMHGARIEQVVVCKFKISENAPLGVHPFRLRTARELTSVSTFSVTPFPIVKEAEEGRGRNDTSEKAETVPAGNVTFAAELHGDADWYKVSRRAGERISVEIDSVWLADVAYADSEYDLSVQIVDNHGTILGRNDDSPLHVQDPILSIVAPQDGDYFVVVKQSVYRDSRVPYLAHIGTFVRPLVAFPPGGSTGAPLTVQLLGDPAGPREATVAWSTSRTVSGSEEFFPTDPAGSPPSPVLLRASALPNVLEQPVGPTPATLPVALNGIISERFEEDRFRLTAKRGERYRVSVFARGIGSPFDPRVTIETADGARKVAEGDDTSIGESRFYSASGGIQRKELLDPTFVWEVGQDGDYLLAISDMRGLGDPLSVYRVEIEPARNSVSTSLFARVIDSMQCPRLTATAVPVGNRWTVTMNLKEGLGNRYKGPLELFARGLPDGVTMTVPPIAAGQSSVPVQFAATADAGPQSALIEVLARPAGEKNADPTFESHSQESFPFVSHSGGRAWHPVTVDRYVLAVTETSPFTIEVVPPKIPLIRNGSLDLDLQVRRNPGFTGPIDVQVEWLPPGVAGGAAVTIPANATSGVYNLTASSGAPIGLSRMALIATTTDGIESGYYTGVDRMRVSTPFFPIEVADPHIDLKSPPTAIRRGQRGKFVWSVEHRRPFDGEATAVLLGLPKGVQMTGPPPRLKSGQKDLTFELDIATDALLGSYRELACEVTLVEKGEEIRERLGRATLRVDP